MIIIGITGSIGMGKTTIAQMLKYLKIPIHDSDQVVKSLLDENTLIIDKIKNYWPICIDYNKKNINKNTLSTIVFNDISERKKLEKLIHPFVVKSRNSFINKNKKYKSTIVALDVPLLYETKTDKICDYIFLASASNKNQKERVLKRSNMNIEKFDKIINNQLSNSEKKKKKPIIITTDYSKFITFVLLILNLFLIMIKNIKLKK